MSMTREEASSVISDMILEMEYPNGIYHQKFTEDESRKHLALYAAKKALRPVSREQVERMRGEWQKYRLNLLICSKCGVFGPNLMKNFRFCPVCGAPMTDEAVEMVIKRLEAVHSDL